MNSLKNQVSGEKLLQKQKGKTKKTEKEQKVNSECNEKVIGEGRFVTNKEQVTNGSPSVPGGTESKDETSSETNGTTKQYNQGESKIGESGGGTNTTTQGQVNTIETRKQNGEPASGGTRAGDGIAKSQASNGDLAESIAASGTNSQDLGTMIELRRKNTNAIKASTSSTYFQQYKNVDVGIKTFQMISDFVEVRDVISYVIYQNLLETNFQQYISLNTDYEKTILGATQDMFRYYATMVQKVLNPVFFEQGGVKVKDGAVQDADMISTISTINSPNDTLAYLSGIIAAISLITDDRRVLREPSTITTTGVTGELSTYVIGPVTTPVQPSPGLIAVGSNILWLQQYIKDCFETRGVKYELGRGEPLFDYTFGVKSVNTYAMNIDHHVATILNRNMQSLLESRGSITDTRDQLLAHSFQDTQIIVDEQGSFRPDEAFDVDHAIRVLVLTSVMYPDMQNLILELNRDVILDSGFLTITSDTDLFYTGQHAEIDQNFTQFVVSRVGYANDELVHTALALEISPVFSVVSKVIAPTVTQPFQCTVMLVEYLLNCWIFPHSFERIKGDVQTDLLQYFDLLFPFEYTTFMRNYGTTYKIINGQKVFSKQNKIWKQADWYLSDNFPSLFANVTFAGCPQMTKICNFFQPLGDNESDTRAKAAKFPRLHRDAQHYIPHREFQSVDTGNISREFRKFTTVIKPIMNAINDTNKTVKSAQSVQNKWLDFITTRLREWDPSFQAHLREIYLTMANNMFNFEGGFSGDFSTYKPTNYCIQIANGDVKKMYDYRGNAHDAITKFATTTVWALIGNGETPLLKRSRVRDNAVAIPAEIIVPLPEPSLRSSLALWQRLKRIILPQAITILLFSKDYLASDPNVRALRQRLPRSGLTDSQVLHMARRIAKLLNVTLDTYGTLTIKALGEVPMLFRMVDPVIRRFDINTHTTIDYDQNYDLDAFKDPTIFMTRLQEDRMLVGLNLFFNNEISKIYQGIRLAQILPSVRSPNYLPPVIDNGYTMVEWNINLFTQMTRGNEKVFVFVLNGQHYVLPSTWPKIHLVISDRTKIPELYLKQIENGIIFAGWAVDVLDFVFSASVLPSSSPMSVKYTILDCLSRNVTKVYNLEFYDDVIRPRPQDSTLATDLNYQYIFPLNEVTNMLTARGLVMIDNAPPEGAAGPDPKEFDTGKILNSGDVAYTSGVLKLESTAISLSNYVRAYVETVKFNSAFEYQISLPEQLFDGIAKPSYRA
jgi:hypothetical protein